MVLSELDPIGLRAYKTFYIYYSKHFCSYTFKTSDVQVDRVDNRRFVRDIGRLEKRIENVEYYTQLSLLESEAQNLQIQDSEGLDRFKNGIIVDNFTGHGIGDVGDVSVIQFLWIWQMVN